MEILNSEHDEDFSSWHIPFYILAVTALELFPKVVLLTRQREGENISTIEKYFKDFGHELDKIYSEEVVGAPYLASIGILNVQKVQDKENLAYFYQFSTGGKRPIIVYHPESLRYGLISRTRSNAAIVAYQNDELLKLCKSVQSAAYINGLDSLPEIKV